MTRHHFVVPTALGFLLVLAVFASAQSESEASPQLTEQSETPSANAEPVPDEASPQAGGTPSAPPPDDAAPRESAPAEPDASDEAPPPESSGVDEAAIVPPETTDEFPSEQAELKRPSYVEALIHGRDLVLNRQYDAARAYFSTYGADHPDDPIREFGLALVAVMERIELRDFRDSSKLDAVFGKAQEAAKNWRKDEGKESFPTLLLGAAEGMQALWWLKTGSKLKGVPRGLSAVGHISRAAKTKPSSPDAVGALGMYLYLKGRYGSRYLFFVPDTRRQGRAITERCAAGEAPVLGPLCRLFLLYINKWEARWADLNQQADAFSEQYPGSMFAPIVQAEGRMIVGNAPGALAVLLRAREHSMDSAMLHYWLGRVYWDGLKMPLQARESWEEALKLGLYDPSRQADAHAGLGEIELAENDYGAARFRFDWALRVDGGSTRARNGSERLESILEAKDR